MRFPADDWETARALRPLPGKCMPPSAIRKAHRNRLLKALSASDHELLEPHFEFREFPLRQVFEEPHRPIKYVYFIEQGFASVVANGAGTRCVEVGLIGREGVTGLPVLIGGDRSPHDTYAQLAGSAHRMTANALREAMSGSATLRTAMLSFVHTFMVQTAQTALANGRATLRNRLLMRSIALCGKSSAPGMEPGAAMAGNNFGSIKPARAVK